MYLVFFLGNSQNFIHLKFLIHSQFFYLAEICIAENSHETSLAEAVILFFFFKYHMDKYENIKLFYKMFKNWLNYKITILFTAYQ